MQDCSSVSFRAYSNDIYRTPGQPRGQIYGVRDWLNVQVGRKGSSGVAHLFNRDLKPHAHSTFAHAAGKLNFFIIGDLKITLNHAYYTIARAYFAQGRSGAS